MKKSKRPVIDQLSGKEVLAGLFSVATGVFDFIENLEAGQDPSTAVKRAVKKSQRRRAALRLAELEVAGDEEKA